MKKLLNVIICLLITVPCCVRAEEKYAYWNLEEPTNSKSLGIIWDVARQMRGCSYDDVDEADDYDDCDIVYAISYIRFVDRSKYGDNFDLYNILVDFINKDDVDEDTDFLDNYTNGDYVTLDLSKEQDNTVVAYYFDPYLFIVSDGKLVLNENSARMFGFNRYLDEIEGLENVDTSHVTNMNRFFVETPWLDTMDLSTFDTSNVESMEYMFASTGMANLDLRSFNTSKVTNMIGMFSNSSIKRLYIDSFDTSKVTNMWSMFSDTDIYNMDEVLSHLDTSSVTNMSQMFLRGKYTELNLENFDTSKVTNMYGMFSQMSNLRFLNLSSFNTSKLTSTRYMFDSSPKLEEIYVSDLFTTQSITDDTYMFYGNYYLAGQDGTTYNSNHTDSRYAIIDGTNNKPGYFSKLTIEFDDKDELVMYVDDYEELEVNHSSFIEIDNFKSDNEKVVTVDEDGEVTAVAPGKATITVMGSNGMFDTKVIYVLPDELNLNVSLGANNSLVLNWSSNSLFKSSIYRSTDNKNWAKLTETNNSTYTNTGLSLGNTYYYKVEVCYKDYCSDYSNVVSKKLLPAKPTIKLNSVGTTNINVGWTKVNVDGYEVYMNNKLVSTITKNSTLSLNKTSLKAGTTYQFKVRAYKLNGKTKVYGDFSNVINAQVLPAKSKATLKVVNAYTIKVTATKKTGASRYEVYRSTSKNGTYTKVADLKNGTRVYNDNKVIAGVTYYYKVRACNAYNYCGAYSSVVSKKTTLAKPKIIVKTNGTKSVKVLITKVTGAHGYEVYRSLKSGSGYTKVGDTKELQLLNTTETGKKYYYKIRAYTIFNNKKLYSKYSAVKNIKSL